MRPCTIFKKQLICARKSSKMQKNTHPGSNEEINHTLKKMTISSRNGKPCNGASLLL